MMDSTTVQQAEARANYCQVFSSPHRIMIACALFERELSVSDLAEEIQATLANTSQHLRLMKARGFVRSRREGRTIYYSMVEHGLAEGCPVFLLARQLFDQEKKEEENV